MFRTNKLMSRSEIILLLKEAGFTKNRIAGIAAMKGNKVDVTCVTRQNVLDLFEKLTTVNEIYGLRLYESDIVNVVIGWVPIPFPEKRLLEHIEKEYGKPNKSTHKIDKDGFKTGVRYITMKREDVEKKPISSYIIVNNLEFYVSYFGQKITCKYCSKPGHKQADCKQRKSDFPRLETATLEQESGLKLNTPTASARLYLTSEIRINASTLLQVARDSQEASTAMESETTAARSKRAYPSPDDLRNTRAKSASVSEKKLPVNCPKCNIEGLTTEQTESYFCWSCSNEFLISKVCCGSDLFLTSFDSESTACPVCKETMLLMPCCKTVQPEYRLEDGAYECANCQRHFTHCKCNQFNVFLGKPLSKACTNAKCKCRLIHCDCGKRYIKEIEPQEPFKCSCGFEYEHDVNIGVRKL
ncbi:uncharacterized protein LOC144750183 [Ciona intestinalis]